MTSFSCGAALAGVICLFMALTSQGMAEEVDTNHAVMELKKNFQQIHERFLAETNNPETAWQFARACFDLAYIASTKPEKARLATEGIASARASLALNSNSAPAHYYLGMNLGELADTKHNLSALGMTKEIEREFLAARLVDERFDYAGAYRNLGLLYLEAPVIFSVGDRTKGLQHLEKAVELAPDFPENLLNLVEALLKQGERVEARKQLDELEKIWPAAQRQFIGDEWALSWVDWDRRILIVRKKLETAPKAVTSPHSTK